MAEQIFLTEELLIGKGAHKKTYIDPADTTRCIKIPYTAQDVDLERELQYRRSRRKRRLKSSLLTAYYGTVATNMGTGYVFERVHDFDGATSQTIQNLFEKTSSGDSFLPPIEAVLSELKKLLFTELIVTSSVEPENFAIQRFSETGFTIRIIDNIGSPVLIPLAYYSDFFARKRIRRYWVRFLGELQQRYPSVMTEEMKKELL